jgi:hypothetical protein
MEELQHGDEVAATKLWNHFIERMVVSARSLLNTRSRRVYDEDDAALSAFRSVCDGITPAGDFRI